MSLVIASQMEESFNAELRAHVLTPTVFSAPEEQPWAAADEADVLLVRPGPVWGRMKHSAPPARWPGRLRWVYTASVGVDFYPRWLLDAPLVTCGRGVASDEIADYVIAALYLHSKNLEQVRARSPEQWRQAPLGRLAGSTLGIIGLGAIGVAVARRALALGLRVAAVRRRSLPSPLDGIELYQHLHRVITEVDHLVLALPATDATRSLIDARALSHARPHLHLVNVARGAVLDQDALLKALDARRIGFATLDVTEPEPLPAGHPLWTHPRVRLTPHVSSNYNAVRHVLLQKIAADLTRFADGQAPSDIVDAVAGY